MTPHWGWGSGGGGSQDAQLLTPNQQGVETDETGFTLLGASDNTIEQSTDEAFEGSGSLKVRYISNDTVNPVVSLDGPGPAIDVSPVFTGSSTFLVSPGELVHFVGLVFTVDEVNSILLQLRYYDADQNDLGEEDTSGFFGGPHFLDGWSQINFNSLVPATAQYMNALIIVGASLLIPFTTYWDGFSLEIARGSAPANAWHKDKRRNR